MKRAHAMPFGASLESDGITRFRLWAPTTEHVTLWLRDHVGERELPMQRRGDGWFERREPDARPGSRYAFLVNGDERRLPDPASRFQPEDVHAPSEVIDPQAFSWEDEDWRGRRWEETILYELHVGTFTPEGTFAGVVERLDALAELGVTAIELMPMTGFAGTRNWGYDSVLPYAPSACYGRPEDLKRLVVEAHRRDMMIFLDVVYSHFGPEGNYLNRYAPQFFTERHQTPWGTAIDFDGEHSRTVRDFFIHNALYWLKEYHVDGLRLDAVHAIHDTSDPDILTEIAVAVRAAVPSDRHAHLVLENDENAARYLCDGGARADCYEAQWSDDVHHALHVLLTGEQAGYYGDYVDAPMRHLGRALTEGFAYQGERSVYRGGAVRGEPSSHLPPTAFVDFLQNHDQVGNRAFGERITRVAPPQAVRAAVAVLLLAPSIPLLFMGEEWGASTPFVFFCDFRPELARQVAEGRWRELERVPNPSARQTFDACVLRWDEIARPPHREWLAFYRDLLATRRREIVPRLPGTKGGHARFRGIGGRELFAAWKLGDGSWLVLAANLSADHVEAFDVPSSARRLFATHERSGATSPPWSVQWFLQS